VTRTPHHRRSLIQSVALAALALTSARPSRADDPPARGREVIDLGEDWRFALANRNGIDVPAEFAGATLPSHDDSGWRRLDVPHDWSIELDPSPGPGTSGGTGFLQGGLGFYRRTFALPPVGAGQRVSIEFDGVYMNSEVYVNGLLVGTHPYGYTGFAFDITNVVHPDGAPNLVAVKVQNQLPSSRWYSGSGIYRDVRLVVTGPVHVARFGTTVTTPDLASTIESGFASVQVVTDVVNHGAGPADIEVSHAIRDPAGRIVARSRSPVPVAPGGARATALLRVDDPVLWSIEAPATYTVETSLWIRHRQVDRVVNRFGVRRVEIDPARGMSINGRYAKIRGVDLHHDLGALGAAVHRDAVWRQLSIMKRMGVNALRTAHNPPAPAVIEACEQLGIVVMVEAFDTWRNNKTEFDYGDWFELEAPGAGGLLWSDVDIMEMVHTFKNSPAVIMWSIGNEIRGQTFEDAARLVADIKSIDTTRPVVWGSDSYRSPPRPGSTNDRIARLLDGVGLNYNTAQSVDALHALYPDRFIFESESSSSTSARGVYQWPHQLNTGEDYTPGQRLVSSYDNNMASWTMPGEYGLKKDRDRQFFTGEFLWSGFDYIGEPTPYGDLFPVKSSFFGAVDTAGFAKDLFYAFASQWTSAPMVHLVPMDWTDHEPGEAVAVWAYANAPEVELFLNGASLGIRRFDRKTTSFGVDYLETTEPTGDDKTFPSGSYTSPNGSTGKLHLTWSVPFAPGELVAVARRDGVEVARDALRTAGPARALRLTPDRFVIDADRRSLAFVTVEVVDRSGVLVPGAQHLIHFEVTGGSLAGVDNGRQESAENYQAPRRAAFNGKALAIVRSDGRAGPLVIRARADGLLPGATAVFEIRGRDRDVGRDRTEPVGVIDPILSAPIGAAPSLPESVTLVLRDGTVRQESVRWSRIERDQLASDRPYDVQGQLVSAPGGGCDRVTAHVTPPSIAAAPSLAATGAPAGSDLTARFEVTVSDGAAAEQNLAPSAVASASFSGSPDTVPAALNDGVVPQASGWSNQYFKQATALLPAFNLAQPRDWVSLTWAAPQRVHTVVAYFRLAPGRALPASVSVEAWNGRTFAPAASQVVTWATESEQPTTIRFDEVSTTRLRLVMTSAAPATPDGFVQISELQAIGHLPDGAPLAARGVGPDTEAGCATSGSRAGFLASLFAAFAVFAVFAVFVPLARRRRRARSLHA
jgi:beta-galactosidase